MAISKAGKRLGRPTVFTPEKMQQLLEHMRSGKTMTSWCKKRKMDVSIVFNFMRSDEGESFHQEFIRAREEGAHALIDATIDLSDEEGTKKKPLDAMRQKLRVDTRMKIAGMWNRRAFGTRPGDGEGVGALTLGELVEAAMAHGRSLQQQPAPIDITPSQPAPRALDAPHTERSIRTRKTAT